MDLSIVEDEGERQQLDDYLKTHLGNKEDYHLTLRKFVPSDSFKLYHVSTDPKIPFFFPRFSVKIYPGENMQIPRTSTSPSIGECLQGYGPIYNENEAGGWGDKKKFNGIYHVYEPMWKYAFAPNKKLVGDVEWSREHWLLYYRPDQFKRPAKLVASFFIKKKETTYRGKGMTTDLVLMLKVSGNEPVWFAKDIKLDPGYYQITLIDYKVPEFEFILNENVFIDKIKESQYQWAYGLRTTSIKNK